MRAAALLCTCAAALISGINHGANLADDVTYSGTVAAAMEGYLLGVPAVAISLVARRHFDFTHAARFATSLVRAVLEKGGGRRMLLNVNVPPKEPKGYRITKLGKHSYGYEVVENVDPRGRKYYWIAGDEVPFVAEKGTDFHAVQQNRISVTPIHLDLTNYPTLEQLEPLRATWP